MASCEDSYGFRAPTLLLFESNETSGIGVLTPYASQRTLLRVRLYDYIQRGLFVSSIDQAQGSEKRMVLVPLVRSSPKFVWNRISVRPSSLKRSYNTC